MVLIARTKRKKEEEEYEEYLAEEKCCKYESIFGNSWEKIWQSQNWTEEPKETNVDNKCRIYKEHVEGPAKY